MDKFYANLHFYRRSVSEDGIKRLSGEFDLEAIMVLDLSDRGTCTTLQSV